MLTSIDTTGLRGRTVAFVVTAVLLGAACAGSDEADRTSDEAPVSESTTESATTGSADSGTDTDAADTGEAADRGEPAGDWAHHAGGLDARRSTDGASAVAAPADLGEAWAIEGLDGVTSEPVVLGDTAYFGDWKGVVHAVDIADGDIVWSSEAGPQSIPGAVAVDETSVYAADRDGWLRALDRSDGSEQWRIRTYDHPLAAVFGSPVVHDGVIYVGVGSYEIVFDRDDYTSQGSVLAVDASDGSEIWRRWTTENDETSGAGVTVWSSPAIDPERGLLFIGTGNTLEEPTAPLADSLIALELESGELVWNVQFTDPDVYNMAGANGADGPDSDVGGGPNLFTVEAGGESLDVVGVGDKAGTYYALERATGEPVWQAELTQGSRLGGVESEAAVGQGLVVVTSNNGGGERQGSADLIALDQMTGEERWRHPLPGATYGPTTIHGGSAWSGDDSGALTRVDLSTGELLDQVQLPGGIGGGITFAGDRGLLGWGFWLFVPPGDPAGGITAFGADGGPLERTPAGVEALGGVASTPEPDEPGDVGLGARLYGELCAQCHGDNGEGGSGPTLAGRMVDAYPDIADQIDVIATGPGFMPGFADELTDEELAAVAEHTRLGFG